MTEHKLWDVFNGKQLARAKRDRLSAAREGVVKALEDLVANFPDVSEPVAVMWKVIQVTLSAENYTAARAALKELEEASK